MNNEEIENARRWLVEIADLLGADPAEQDSDALATLSAGLRILDENTLNSLEHVSLFETRSGELLKRSWDVALGHYLSDYPTNKTPEEILEMLEADSDEVTNWEPFEYSDGGWVAEHIETMHTYILGELLWARGEDEPEPAPAEITNVTDAAASPRLTASASPALGSAVNPCTDGEPSGWGVYCSDGSSEWIESGFSDEEAAERFAAAWKTFSDENEARTAVIMVDNRTEYEGEPCTVYTGCMECDHETEFTGWEDSHDVAHFPCDNCGAIFTIADWSEFFDEDEEDE